MSVSESRESEGVRLRLSLPAVHRSVRMARSVVRRLGRLWGMAGGDLDSITLVTSELLENSVDHGGGGGALVESDLGRQVRMHLELCIDGSCWILRVSDEGGGDAEEVRGLINPDGLPDLESERGRGFFLLSNMVDELRVDPSSDGSGLTITATKRLGGGRD